MRASEAARIVIVSSDLGSFANTLTNDWWDWQQEPPLYAASKSALTMLTLRYARALPGMRVNAAAPGWTATDLNAFQGVQTVTEGTDAIIRLATLPPDGPTGTYLSRHGEVPW
ncbi:SDR family NAD(P)-dependent oxidoreductase [Actinoplanes sp. NPDC049265]|uniref:SDR family NAD(P)-dependent oxidoreductase n=1 Tax=Actinoplanes sp. NPDC049265 TaxID=3363902 RepID=UPI0037153968